MEYWDIYDSNKKRTGRTMERNDWNMAPGDYHLTVLGVITSPTGSFLITKRREDKEWAPGAWEVTGGGVKAGETSVQAVKREAREETGLSMEGVLLEYMGDYRSDNPAEKNNYYVDIYHLTIDFSEKDVHLQKDETADFAVVDLDRIRDLGNAGQFLHYERLLPVLERIHAGFSD